MLLVSLMLLGALAMWVAVPFAWLWIGSQLQNSAGLGTAIAVMMVGVIATILGIVPILAWLNRKHVELREARGFRAGEHTALEVILVLSAGIAVVGFTIWFFGFAGTSPIPLNLSY